MIFHEAAKVKIIVQAAAVASASVANRMLVSELAPCCGEALLEGSCCNCSDWNLAYTCLVCVCGGGVGDTTMRAGLSLLLGICQDIWEDSKEGFVCSITSLLLMLASVWCASDVRLFLS